MRYSADRSRESGVVLLAVLALLVVAIAVVAFVFVHNKQKDQGTDTSETTTTSTGAQEGSAERNANNVRRKSDGSHALAVTAEYMSNNQGSLPDTSDQID